MQREPKYHIVFYLKLIMRILYMIALDYISPSIVCPFVSFSFRM